MWKLKVSVVQGCCNPVALWSSQFSLHLCVNLNPRTGGKRVAKVPGFALNILQSDSLLMLLYFKSKKTFPRHLGQVYPVCHSSEYGHLPGANSSPVSKEIFVLPDMASSSIPNKGLRTSLSALTADNYP